MQKTAIDTRSVNESADLISLAGALVELRSASGKKEFCGPCPKCGGTDRFYVQADFFACRGCHEKRGDAIEFMQWLHGVDFRAAVAMLTNAPLPTAQAAPRRPQARPAAQQLEDWGPRAQELASHAHARLMSDSDIDAAAARRYLDGRQLAPQTWVAFGLGYTPAAALPGTKGQIKAPAIVMPWYRAGKVAAIRYRFFEKHAYTDQDGKQRTEKQSALAGSSFAGILYGGQAMARQILGLSTLLICEGELNAVSIWQAAHNTNLHVLSLGSESAHITPAMAAHAAQYERVLIWMDKGERARAAMGALPGAYGIQSPGGQDANDLLQAGALAGFVGQIRAAAAQTPAGRERVLWDLYDAAQTPAGASGAPWAVIQSMGQELGRNV
jgi:hypothetical protein